MIETFQSNISTVISPFRSFLSVCVRLNECFNSKKQKSVFFGHFFFTIQFINFRAHFEFSCNSGVVRAFYMTITTSLVSIHEERHRVTFLIDVINEVYIIFKMTRQTKKWMRSFVDFAQI